VAESDEAYGKVPYIGLNPAPVGRIEIADDVNPHLCPRAFW